MSRVSALLLLVGLTACETRNVVGVGGQTGATVRVVNATSTAIDVVTNGSVSTGNRALPFGGSTGCFTVDPAAPGLILRPTGSSAALSGTLSSLAGGGSFVVVVFPGPAGAPTFITLGGVFTPTTGRSALRIFDAAQTGTNYDVYVTAPGAALGTPIFINLGYGFSTPFAEIDAGTRQIRFTTVNTQNVAIDAGSQTLAANRSSTLMLALPSPFLVTSCS